ncbi:hypothetical protein CXR04_11865 [Streptomyces sp. CMB-StM0423]|nr:hypothetical protein CXR04_11865 [Streptomyces sp. CMB-StM0423]
MRGPWPGRVRRGRLPRPCRRWRSGGGPRAAWASACRGAHRAGRGEVGRLARCWRCATPPGWTGTFAWTGRV